MKQIIFITLTMFLISCNSVAELKSKHTKFLVENLSINEQSSVLSAKGVLLYKNLEKELDYQSIPHIRTYFLKSLYLNKNNEEAINYLKKINEFKSKNFNLMYQTAIKYKDLPKKTEQDKFNMCFYLQKALEISPNHVKGISFLNDIKTDRDSIINEYLANGKEIKALFLKSLDNTKKEQLLVNGLSNFGKILLLDPNNKNAYENKKYFESLIIEEMDIIIKELTNEIVNNNYKNFNTKTLQLVEYNSKIDNKMKKEINHLYYLLYYTQSNYFLNLNRLSIARKKIKSALMYEKNLDAIKIERKINNLISYRVSSYQESSTIESAITEIESLIKENELAVAMERINTKISLTKDKNEIIKLNQLKSDLQKQIQIIIPEMYQNAISDYNNENFREAIVKFREIISIDLNYDRAQDYLQKAVKRQELLDTL